MQKCGDTVLTPLILHIGGVNQWTFPERDASGRVKGISTRHRTDGTKRAISGSKRGLTYADDWHDSQGPVYLVEGGSDTAACMTMGLSAMGRPSNLGGVDDLAELLRPHEDREIVVLGERDFKADTNRWPGRDGAISIAKQLAEQLNRSIGWALPPEGFKDVREYLNAPGPKPEWSLDVEIVAPPPPAEPYQEPLKGPVRSLDIFREDLFLARVKAIKKPEIYFDGSPTGSGKSYADSKILEHVLTSLTVVPTHANGDELVAALCKQFGLDATKLPARVSPEEEDGYWHAKAEYESKHGVQEDRAEWNYGVCRNKETVKEAEDYGLSPGAAVCPSCEFRIGCDFIEKRDLALNGSHLVATHKMFQASRGKICNQRDYLAVHEDANELLRHKLTISASDLQAIFTIAAEAKYQETKRRPGNVDINCVEVFDILADTAQALIAAVEAAERTHRFVPPEHVKLPSVVQARLLNACRSAISRQSGPNEDERYNQASSAGNLASAMEMMLGLISGKLHLCVIKVEQPKKKCDSMQFDKSVIGIFKTELPENTPVIFSDATGSAARIELLSGREVVDITPDGILEPRHLQLQVPRDIKRRTKATTVASLLAATMLKYPNAQRIGVIGHKPHIDNLMADNSPLGGLRGRISKTAYFGQGDDKASNSWHKDCGLLLILGTPRVPPEVIQAELLRIGDLESMEQDGEWKKQRWTAATESGGRRVIHGVGYEHSLWRAAHGVQVTAALQQAIGRARSNLPNGIPVIVFSNENVGLTVSDEVNDIKPLSQLALERYAWFEEQVAKSVNNITYTFCNFTTGEIVNSWRWKKDRVSKVLRELGEAGYLTKLSHGKWAVTKLLESSVTEPSAN